MRHGGNLRPQGRARRGTVTIIMALSLTSIMGIAAITLDGGMLLAERRRAQAISDASALAAASSLSAYYSTNSGTDPSGKAKAAALSIASGNGYTNDGKTSTVTVNIPPTSGTFSGKTGYAEVIVTSIQPRLMSALWGAGSMSAGARSVARCDASTPAPGILVLDPSASGALTCAGSAMLKSSTSIQVNSSSGSAANANNTGHANAATTINIVGGSVTSSSGYFVGTLRPGSASVPDPLASLATPTTAGLTTIASNWYAPGYGNCTMQPGVYNGGVNFTQIGGGRNVTMMPGIYYMKGGDFNFGNGCNLTDNGAGVLIYTEPGYSIKLNGGSSIALTAQKTGTYAGIVFFEDRTSTAACYIDNNSASTINGAFYAAGAFVHFAGGAAYNQTGQFICRTVTADNNAQVTITSTGGGSSNPPIRLAE